MQTVPVTIKDETWVFILEGDSYALETPDGRRVPTMDHLTPSEATALIARARQEPDAKAP